MRDIPAEIKRAVRQRDGYGCVICGHPIVQYEHFEEYSKVGTHEESNIWLACANHHDEKHKGLLPLDKIQKARQSPYNKEHGRTAEYPLHYSGNDCAIHIGDNVMEATLSEKLSFLRGLDIDNEEVIGFRLENEQLLLNCRAYNKEGVILFHIQDNELVMNTDNWDIESTSNSITIRNGLGDIFLKLKISPPAIFIDRADFYTSKGRRICVAKDGERISLDLMGIKLSGNSFGGGGSAIKVSQ